MDHPTRSFQAPTGDQPTIARLLLVEDDVDLSRTLERTLSQDGFEVTLAKDGVVASEALMTVTFDLVLSDISLPGTSGVDLLRLVRAYDLDVPVILMTGNPTIETASQAVELGALQYLVKPVTMETLRPAVARGLTLGRLARAKRETLATAEGSKHIGDRSGLIVAFENVLAEMYLAFQPIVDHRQRKIFAYEVLLRSPVQALPNPAAVLDAAERLGAIQQLGRRVRALAAHAIQRLPSPEVLLFVNIHADELVDSEIYEGNEPLSRHAARVVLEVTERASLDSLSDAAARARRLRALGYRLAIDDLGAGYAGLTGLTTLEPEFVKLDMSLVRNIGHSMTKQRVVRSIVDLSRDLSMHVIAEGVETREEMAHVTELGCGLLQGYYLGKPSETPALAPL